MRLLEVFTGSGRRREWSDERKAEIAAESYESGEAVYAVAPRHELTPQQLFTWRRLVREPGLREITGGRFRAWGILSVPNCQSTSPRKQAQWDGLRGRDSLHSPQQVFDEQDTGHRSSKWLRSWRVGI
ncbi:transposase [Mesorhizobium ventifaucium]|uniref:transposase n=1 Tax=Mesorhizobium ventifaucium TaxID=666020 RepID=UPI0020A73FC7|nr:transposase [Mesorhizobium ventifaucium]